MDGVVIGREGWEGGRDELCAVREIERNKVLMVCVIVALICGHERSRFRWGGEVKKGLKGDCEIVKGSVAIQALLEEPRRPITSHRAPGDVLEPPWCP